MKRLTAGVILMVLVLGVPMLQSEPGAFWLGLTYINARRGGTPEQGLALGILGLYSSTLHMFAWGFVLGPAGGVVAGVVVAA